MAPVRGSRKGDPPSEKAAAKKSRLRKERLSEAQKEYDKALNNRRVQLHNAKKDMRKSLTYQAATESQKQAIEAQAEASVDASM